MRTAVGTIARIAYSLASFSALADPVLVSTVLSYTQACVLGEDISTSHLVPICCILTTDKPEDKHTINEDDHYSGYNIPTHTYTHTRQSSVPCAGSMQDQQTRDK